MEDSNMPSEKSIFKKEIKMKKNLIKSTHINKKYKKNEL